MKSREILARIASGRRQKHTRESIILKEKKEEGGKENKGPREKERGRRGLRAYNDSGDDEIPKGNYSVLCTNNGARAPCCA